MKHILNENNLNGNWDFLCDMKSTLSSTTKIGPQGTFINFDDNYTAPMELSLNFIEALLERNDENRSVREENVKRLMNRMENDGVIYTSQGIVLGRVNGDFRLLDGQHRLLAMKELWLSGKLNTPPTVMVTIAKDCKMFKYLDEQSKRRIADKLNLHPSVAAVLNYFFIVDKHHLDVMIGTQVIRDILVSLKFDFDKELPLFSRRYPDLRKNHARMKLGILLWCAAHSDFSVWHNMDVIFDSNLTLQSPQELALRQFASNVANCGKLQLSDMVLVYGTYLSLESATPYPATSLFLTNMIKRRASILGYQPGSRNYKRLEADTEKNSKDASNISSYFIQWGRRLGYSL